MARLFRAFHPEGDLAAGQTVTLGAEESHHLRRVLRLVAGERLLVFDGRGGEWVARLLPGSERSVRVELEQDLPDRVECELPVVLCQGLGRAERMDWVVQKATELGLSAIEFYETSRAETSRGPRRLERWQRIAVEACKQSGRRRVPRVECYAAWPPPRGAGIALLCHRGAGAAAFEAGLHGPPPVEVRLAVGPEAGLAEEEVRLAAEAGWRLAHLGPRVLRTETAGLVAAALVLHRWGDLGVAGDSAPAG